MDADTTATAVVDNSGDAVLPCVTGTRPCLDLHNT